jgi:hypothetical protein
MGSVVYLEDASSTKDAADTSVADSPLVGFDNFIPIVDAAGKDTSVMPIYGAPPLPPDE